MIKAGVLGSSIGLIYVMSLTFLSPFCTLCFTPVLGVGVGYLAAKFEQADRVEMGVGRGSIAGAITSVGVVLGQVLATVVNGILITNLDDLPTFMTELGLPPSLVPEANEYWQSTILAGSVCSVFNLLVIVGLGAIGGMLWVQRHHPKQPTMAQIN